MGQKVAVTEKPSSAPGVVRFEVNRTLSGQGHERFTSIDDAVGPRPSAELARRLFATGRVDQVHVYANIVTVDLAKGFTSEGLRDVLADLHQYWLPGVEPPSFEDLQPAEETSSGGGGGDAGDGGGELSEAAKRVPAHLLERSREARERWNAKRG